MLTTFQDLGILGKDLLFVSLDFSTLNPNDVSNSPTAASSNYTEDKTVKLISASALYDYQAGLL
jgi:hypothetical protein